MLPTDDAAAAPIILPSKPQAPRRRRVAAKTIRLRDKEHCKFVAFQPCVVCGRTPSEAHHIRFAQPRALGRKVSDEYTVPVCRLHHRELHGYGDEASWWAAVSIDPLPIALELWRRTRVSELPVSAEEMSASPSGRPEQGPDPDPRSRLASCGFPTNLRGGLIGWESQINRSPWSPIAAPGQIGDFRDQLRLNPVCPER